MDIKKEREDFEKLWTGSGGHFRFFEFDQGACKYILNGVTDGLLRDDLLSASITLNTTWIFWLARAKSKAVPECVWVESYDGSVFESSCGHTFELSNDGTLDDNNMKHCCFCGGKIEAQEQSHD